MARPSSSNKASSSSSSSSSLGKRKQAARPPPPASPSSASSSGSIEADFSEGDDDDDDEDDGLGELEDSEEDEFEEDRQNPSRVAMWEDDEGEGSEEESDEDEEEAGEDSEEEGRQQQPVGSKDKGKGKATELARLQNDLRSLPLATLLRAQRNLPDPQDGSDSDSNDGDEQDDEDDEEQEDPEAQKKERVAEARRKLAELMRIKKGGAPETPVEEQQRKERERKVLQKRSDKHAPTEVSSKRQVSRKRVVVEVEKVERRDPRFSSLSGSLDPHLHSKAYAFIPDLLSTELSTLQASLKIARKAVLSAPRVERAEKEADVERIEGELGRVRTRKEREARERRERDALGGWKREEREKRKEGKGEWHMGDAEKKRLLATAKHTALLAQGGQYAVKKSLDKKIKKQDGKEKKSRPRGLGFGGDSAGGHGGDRKRVKM